jgi:serine O-acetyltransferase
MDQLTFFIHRLFKAHNAQTHVLPSKPATQHFTDALLALLFPHHAGDVRRNKIEEIQAGFLMLRSHLLDLLHSLRPHLKKAPEHLAEQFFDHLPEIYDLLWLDAQAIYEGDPAAESTDEVIAAYPGFYAIFAYRIAHIFYEQQVPVLPRMITEYAHYKTGIDIHPGAHIGRSFCIDHGTGIVIGETTVIGNNVKIYQGVSLGALSVSKELAKTKRHPTIEDNVIVYSNATILGGNTVIGHDSIIGGNVWLTQSVPPYSVVYNTFESKIRSKKRIEGQIMFHI